MADDSIGMFDETGREIEVSREKWLGEILPKAIRGAWDDSQTLYAILVAAMNQKAGMAVIDGIRRLAEIDADPQQPAVLEGIALMQDGQIAAAEKLFNEFIEKHGPTAAILTNLAKIQYERGEKAEAEIILRRAIDLDANLENSLGWYLSLQRARGGEDAVLATLNELAADPRNWRARLWIAARLLKEKRNDDAIAMIQDALTQSEVSPEALVQITGELGRAQLVQEMIDLILPIYDLKRHGPLVGLNLLQALISQGLTMEAADVLVALEGLKHPALKEILKDMSSRLVQSAAAHKKLPIAPPPAVAPGEMQVAAVPLIHPLWTAWVNKPAWLLPPPRPDAIKVALFSLADLTLPRSGDAPVKNDTSPISRSLPLYLAEALRLRSDAASLCVIPVAPRLGPATIGAPWPLPQMLATCPPEFQPDYVVCGALTRGSRGPKVELHVFRVKDKEPLKTIRVATADDFTGATAGCERDLLACLAGEGVKPRESILPPPQSTSDYVNCLGHLLIQTLAASGLIDAARLPQAAAMLEACFTLAETDATSPLPLLLTAAALAATLHYAPPAAGDFKPRLLDLLQKRAEQFKVIRQVAPAVYRILRETDLLNQARAAADSSDEIYARWLAGL